VLLSVTGLLVLAAFVCVILAAIGKAPLWIPVLLLTVIAMLSVWPIGK
jgi:hypothetical protein